LGKSEWRTMKYEDIVRFADATGDHQWIHVDRERVKRDSPFGAPIAHGYFTLSLIAGLFFEMVETRNFGMVINYGLNKVRFPASRGAAGALEDAACRLPRRRAGRASAARAPADAHAAPARLPR